MNKFHIKSFVQIKSVSSFTPVPMFIFTNSVYTYASFIVLSDSTY